MIDLARLLPYVRRKLVMASRPAAFRHFAMLLLGASYELGRENLFETDCSGTICWPLFCLGYRIRMTAEDLAGRLFIHHGDAEAVQDYYDRVLAVFYQRAGRVRHVAPIVGRGVVLDAVEPSQPVQLKALEPVVRWYTAHGYGIFIRQIEWRMVESISQDAEASWAQNTDEMLQELSDAFPG